MLVHLDKRVVHYFFVIQILESEAVEKFVEEIEKEKEEEAEKKKQKKTGASTSKWTQNC